MHLHEHCWSPKILHTTLHTMLQLISVVHTFAEQYTLWQKYLRRWFERFQQASLCCSPSRGFERFVWRNSAPVLLALSVFFKNS